MWHTSILSLAVLAADGQLPYNAVQSNKMAALARRLIDAGSPESELKVLDLKVQKNVASTNLMRSTEKQTMATARPTLPIEVARTSRCSCNGVLADSVMTSDIVFPYSVFTPTATTRMDPDPSFNCNISASSKAYVLMVQAQELWYYVVKSNEALDS